MSGAMTIENGFVEVDAGSWLVSHGQPVAFFGKTVRRRRKGWILPDRSNLDLVETSGMAKCADRSRPFLTHIPCAAPISAVSSKVLVAPAESRVGAQRVKLVPMSVIRSLCVTDFGSEWIVTATEGRTARIQVSEGDTLSVRPDAVVAWSGERPTGFCPKLGVFDVILPRTPRDLLLTFYGPAIVWVEGSKADAKKAVALRRAYVV